MGLNPRSHTSQGQKYIKSFFLKRKKTKLKAHTLTQCPPCPVHGEPPPRARAGQHPLPSGLCRSKGRTVQTQGEDSPLRAAHPTPHRGSSRRAYFGGEPQEVSPKARGDGVPGACTACIPGSRWQGASKCGRLLQLGQQSHVFHPVLPIPTPPPADASQQQGKGLLPLYSF